MLRAQLLLAQGRHDEALAMFDVHMPIALDEGLAYMSPVLYADLAWCRVPARTQDAALVDARVAEAGFGADCEAEDRAGAHGRLAQVFEALGLAEDARSHAAQARRASAGAARRSRRNSSRCSMRRWRRCRGCRCRPRR